MAIVSISQNKLMIWKQGRFPVTLLGRILSLFFHFFSRHLSSRGGHCFKDPTTECDGKWLVENLHCKQMRPRICPKQGLFIWWSNCGILYYSPVFHLWATIRLWPQLTIISPQGSTVEPRDLLFLKHFFCSLSLLRISHSFRSTVTMN